MGMAHLCAHSEIIKLKILGVSEQIAQQMFPDIVRDKNELITLKYKYLQGELEKVGTNSAAQTGPSEFPRAAEKTVTTPWDHVESGNEIGFPFLSEIDNMSPMDYEMEHAMNLEVDDEMDYEMEHEMEYEMDHDGHFGLNFNPFEEVGALPTEREHNELLLDEFENTIGNVGTESSETDEDDDWIKRVLFPC